MRPGTLAIVGAAMLWGSMGPIVALYPKASALTLAAWRLIIGALALVVAVSAGRGWTSWRRDELATTTYGVLAMAGYSALYFPAVQLAGVATATVVSIGAAPLLSGAAHTFSGARVDRRWLTGTSVAVVGMCLVVLPGSHDPASRLGILLATLRGRAAGRVRPGRRSRLPTRSFPRAVRPRRRPPRHHDSRIPRGDLLVGPVGLALEGGEEPVERVELPQVVPAPVEGVPVDGLQLSLIHISEPTRPY